MHDQSNDALSRSLHIYYMYSIHVLYTFTKDSLGEGMPLEKPSGCVDVCGCHSKEASGVCLAKPVCVRARKNNFGFNGSCV